MKDARQDRPRGADGPEEQLVRELEQLATILLERGKIAAGVVDPWPPAEDQTRSEHEQW